MNSCLLFFGLVDFFFLGVGIPPEKPRINTDQSGGSGDGSLPSGVQGQSPGRGSGDEAGAFCTFAHNILKNGYRKCVFRHNRFFAGQRGEHGPSGPMVNTLVDEAETSQLFFTV